MERSSSNLLLYHNYSGNLDIDPSIASSLLGAFENFSQVELKGFGIKYIEMAIDPQNVFRWVYLSEPDYNLLLIGAGDTFENPEIIRSQLDVIFEKFCMQYQIKPNVQREATVKVDQFEVFKKTLDIFNDQWNQVSIYNDSAIVFDLLGFFQQLFNEIHYLILHNFKDPILAELLQGLQDYWNKLKKQPEIAQNPVMYKIKFSKLDGWNVIELDPKMLDPEEIKELLMSITKELRNLLAKYFKVDLPKVVTSQIFPYFIQEYDVMEKLKISKMLINLFGVIL
jgi:hypothetical protein